MENGNGKLLNHDITIWQLLALYWRSNKKWYAFFVFFVVMSMTIMIVGINLVFNYWYNDFYNALQNYDKTSTMQLLVLFFCLAGVYIIVAVYRYFIAQIFGIRWREWLTKEFISRWLKHRSYYLLENFYEKTDNPDQRIQEDIGMLVKFSIDLTIGMVEAVTTFAVFISVLWNLSGTIHIDLDTLGVWHIPGYLMWVAMLYSIGGTYITYKIGNKLVPLNFEQQRLEATFRFAAIDLRTHAEHVALYRGEHHQKIILNSLFDKALFNYYLIVLRQKSLLWFTASYNQVSVVLPLLVALPNFFGKVFLLGGLVQTLKAFAQVQDSLSFIVNSYTSIAEWQAISKRLTTFVNQIHRAEDTAKNENKLIQQTHSGNNIVAAGVGVNKPTGESLLTNINIQFNHGQNYLIKGESGIGKSTFVRTIAGIWPYSSGVVTLPSNQKIMYMPQKSYMPIGTLAEAILFPDKHNPDLEKRLPEVLRLCHLDQLVNRLQDHATWSEQLSPGEQQRIGFARILLHQPDWVFMDESTSMLDMANEKYLYELLKEKLPGCSIVSVGHRPSIDMHHENVIDMGECRVD